MHHKILQINLITFHVTYDNYLYLKHREILLSFNLLLYTSHEYSKLDNVPDICYFTKNYPELFSVVH